MKFCIFGKLLKEYLHFTEILKKTLIFKNIFRAGLQFRFRFGKIPIPKARKKLRFRFRFKLNLDNCNNAVFVLSKSIWIENIFFGCRCRFRFRKFWSFFRWDSISIPIGNLSELQSCFRVFNFAGFSLPLEKFYIKFLVLESFLGLYLESILSEF